MDKHSTITIAYVENTDIQNGVSRVSNSVELEITTATKKSKGPDALQLHRAYLTINDARALHKALGKLLDEHAK